MASSGVEAVDPLSHTQYVTSIKKIGWWSQENSPKSDKTKSGQILQEKQENLKKNMKKRAKNKAKITVRQIESTKTIKFYKFHTIHLTKSCI